MYMARIIGCRECGEKFTQKNPAQTFCSPAHRDRFNGRRKLRGSKLYDLVMQLRFEREPARSSKVWSLICRLASNFAHEDKQERAGRKSWEDIDVVRKRHVRHVATRHWS
jgi:hypothetical protein